MTNDLHCPKTRIVAEDLAISYGHFTALRAKQVKFEGNIIAIVGHNGAGKSTLIKGILRLLPFSGKLQTWNVTSQGESPLVPEHHMAFCPECGSVFSDISVESYVRLWCRMKHSNADYYKKEGSKYIEMLHLGPLLHKLGRELSKGQRRRVQTAIGFLSNARFFLVDEPFDGLDVQKTNELADIIMEQSIDKTFLISSHRMDVVERLADVIVVLKEGEFAAIGSVEDVCVSLCGRSFVINNLADSDALLPLLKLKFPSSLVNRIGQQISVVGENIDLDQLIAVVRAQDANGATINVAQPSLVDAMNYHLRGLL